MTEPTAAPAPAATPDTYPGKGLGIASIIVAFFISLLGLILAIVAKTQSKNAGYKNTPANVGLVLSIVFLVLQIIGIILLTTVFASLFNVCAGQAPGEYLLSDGTTVTCG